MRSEMLVARLFIYVNEYEPGMSGFHGRRAASAKKVSGSRNIHLKRYPNEADGIRRRFLPANNIA